jgi:hypothetical protein
MVLPARVSAKRLPRRMATARASGRVPSVSVYGRVTGKLQLGGCFIVNLILNSNSQMVEDTRGPAKLTRLPSPSAVITTLALVFALRELRISIFRRNQRTSPALILKRTSA